MLRITGLHSLEPIFISNGNGGEISPCKLLAAQMNGNLSLLSINRSTPLTSSGAYELLLNPFFQYKSWI